MDSRKETAVEAATKATLQFIAGRAAPLLWQMAAADTTEGLAEVRPRPGDLERVFSGVDFARLAAASEKVWTQPLKLRVGAEQTVLDIVACPAGLLAQDNELSRAFPGGYRAAAAFLNPHFVWLTWRFRSPHEASGVRFDGLVWVDDHWSWFPKPYRLLREQMSLPTDH
jgi:hypothetical protein